MVSPPKQSKYIEADQDKGIHNFIFVLRAWIQHLTRFTFKTMLKEYISE